MATNARTRVGSVTSIKIHHLSLQRINHKSLLGTSIMAAHHLPSIMPIGCRDLIMGFKISSVIGELKYEPGLQSLVVKLKRERERERVKIRK